nr:MAG TPA: hypothetical protein [Caudoviricetes sp.]
MTAVALPWVSQRVPPPPTFFPLDALGYVMGR